MVLFPMPRESIDMAESPSASMIPPVGPCSIARTGQLAAGDAEAPRRHQALRPGGVGPLRPDM